MNLYDATHPSPGSSESELGHACMDKTTNTNLQTDPVKMRAKYIEYGLDRRLGSTGP